MRSRSKSSSSNSWEMVSTPNTDKIKQQAYKVVKASNAVKKSMQ